VKENGQEQESMITIDRPTVNKLGASTIVICWPAKWCSLVYQFDKNIFYAWHWMGRE
jgi:hypothetical protein